MEKELQVYGMGGTFMVAHNQNIHRVMYTMANLNNLKNMVMAIYFLKVETNILVISKMVECMVMEHIFKNKFKSVQDFGRMECLLKISKEFRLNIQKIINKYIK